MRGLFETKENVMKRIVFTKHAEEMLSVRHIDRSKVKSALTQPSRRIKAKEGKVAYFKDFGVNYLKVVVSEENDALVVVTLYWVAKHRINR